MKFGGSCLVDNTAFNKILKITELYNKTKKVFIASAFNGITDLLLKAAQSINNQQEVNETVAVIEKRHIDVIDQIFDEESIYYSNSKDWVDKNLIGLIKTLVN